MNISWYLSFIHRLCYYYIEARCKPGWIWLLPTLLRQNSSNRVGEKLLCYAIYSAVELILQSVCSLWPVETMLKPNNFKTKKAKLWNFKVSFISLGFDIMSRPGLTRCFDKSIKNWCSVAFWVVEIYDWFIIWNFFDLMRPQWPPTEKVLKFNMSFHDSVNFSFLFKTSE